MNTGTRTLLYATLLACRAATGSEAATIGDPYQHMRLHWQSRLVGDGGTAADAAIVNTARRHLDSMATAPDARALWADAAGWHQPNGTAASAVITANYTRLESMALAHAQPGSALHGDVRLRDAILHGLAWMERHHYRAGAHAYGNWWDWQIGTPHRLANSLTLMYADLPADLLARCLAAIDHFSPDPTRRTLPDGTPGPDAETGANRLDKALIASLRGVLGRSAPHIAAGRDAVAGTLASVTRGDGFYADGSFVQHDHVAYTGSYGRVALDNYAKLVYLHNGSQWPLPATTLDGILHWVREAYVPWLFDGAMADAVRGRRISTESQDDRHTGRRILASLAALAQSAPAGRADDIKAFVKSSVHRGLLEGASAPGSALGSHDLRQLRDVAADASIPAAGSKPGARVYASMDRALLHGEDFGFAVSMYSDRISAFEYGNGEHARGWWTGIGMTTLYTADRAQYGGHYWPTVDAWRLPGTTTDHSGKGLPPAWAMLGNRDGWSGGAQLDGYAAVALRFDMRDVTGSDLRGNKSWFLLGRRIVATGTGITGSGAVETIVDNRKLSAPGSGVLTVDGHVRVPSIGASDSVARAGWAHLAGSEPGGGIGYAFPDGTPLQLLRETRIGSWRDINAAESSTPVRNTFVSLAIGHGTHPRDAAYSYVLLPGADASTTAAYAARPAVTLLENSNTASAVRDASIGVIAANFWQPGVIRLDGRDYLSANSPASILLHEEPGTLALGIAEPTQHRAEDVLVTVHRPVSALLEADPRVKVISLRPVLRLRIAPAGSAGRSLIVRFSVQP
ncbi:polysaccharide lyase 8 family protein [Pseudoduganella lutea]|uniref:Hyaluronate lyase n=1 Tax=Pseudoduganella lutea TaxID=321985 RepID=A0A4P6KVF5_9BURK|nr:polysaccharide lyase 8 family protein [Pseudoduganella lutea]QBE62744.1 hyaluronate lyase [Pseudoduganella lutea]